MNSFFVFPWNFVHPLPRIFFKGMVCGALLGGATFFPSLRVSLTLGLILMAFEMLTSFNRAQYCAWIGKIGMMCAMIPYAGEMFWLHYLSYVEGKEKAFHGGLWFCIFLGSILGTVVAKRTPMTELPQLMALFHSLVGIGAASISVVLAKVHISSSCAIPFSVFFEILAGGIIGAITFTGSVFAVLRLQNIVRYTPSLKVFTILFLVVLLGALGSAFWFFQEPSIFSLIISITLSSIFGILMILPVAGADMPLVVSLLNSCSGWACVSLGIYSSSPLLIVVGSIVGFSGAVLTTVMCQGMNRSLTRVFTGSFHKKKEEKISVVLPVQSISGQEAAFFLKSAERVLIVPGYGAAVAQAQTALQELALLLKANHCDVQYGMHPVAGRMPGHMDILLAQANVPLEDMVELGEANRRLSETDVVLIVGANDTVNPLAEQDSSSEIYGMPIFQAYRAKKVLFVKRSMSVGYSGIDNPLCYLPQTYMVFGDGKKVCEDILKALALL
ncbi:NAD(P) transhydrogenase subunit beta [Holospora elegans E1]|uniref:proton-translocating NAD(P)(+) transhydrogenase n=1 Tax=Holospora elegans E1 TaxID=1427503 RepID=A0A023DZL3_9PROT|nr:NAD(P)(+) transhydrogenase (Re/Si-specific) subunit beta [Holospora elegans]GAJ46465.1 NAD(P) transhydrogenase subunit beta [Holospora elegans E1]